MTTIRKLAWIHVEDRRLLCARSAGRPLFYIPGGKPEAGEDDLTALTREIAEELGVAIDPATARLYGRFTAPAEGRPGVEVAVDAYFAAHEGTPRPSAEIDEIRPIASADAASVSAVAQIILQQLKAEDVID